MKRNADGEVEKYKARFVTRGFTQTYGVDYTDTYAPTSKPATIRAVIAIAASNNLNLHQLDIKSAYLNANVEEVIYMEPPEGFVQYDVNGNKLICCLKKSLYGLKQAGANWNRTINAFLIEIGFIRSKVDPCLYIRNENETKSLMW